MRCPLCCQLESAELELLVQHLRDAHSVSNEDFLFSTLALLRAAPPSRAAPSAAPAPPPPVTAAPAPAAAAAASCPPPAPPQSPPLPPAARQLHASDEPPATLPSLPELPDGDLKREPNPPSTASAADSAAIEQPANAEHVAQAAAAPAADVTPETEANEPEGASCVYRCRYCPAVFMRQAYRRKHERYMHLGACVPARPARPGPPHHSPPPDPPIPECTMRVLAVQIRVATSASSAALVSSGHTKCAATAVAPRCASRRRCRLPATASRWTHTTAEAST